MFIKDITEGFGVITEINMHETLKNTLGVEIKKYRILGACNPSFAYKALLVEDIAEQVTEKLIKVIDKL